MRVFFIVVSLKYIFLELNTFFKCTHSLSISLERYYWRMYATLTIKGQEDESRRLSTAGFNYTSGNACRMGIYSALKIEDMHLIQLWKRDKEKKSIRKANGQDEQGNKAMNWEEEANSHYLENVTNYYTIETHNLMKDIVPDEEWKSWQKG
ncbi:hypothetical protein BDF20DRAFT_835201 [Mycotypha africana]|uniref:uncharacterized protein n=1 Tax=Mycotypha africana TaxID=64632 RepID=UPI002301F697|nr:uncharacterized protein BDF20DRAFT_835201 [Mycotypha africana]KAI8979141.1 hypothetical protein BDF20DRAFT_835201 [Mycotypha africana]